MPHPTRIPVLTMLAVLLLLTAGCGQKSGGNDTGLGHGAYLDPPETATLEILQGPAGIPVLCYHYFRGGFDPAYLTKVLGTVLLGMPTLGPREFWTTPASEFEKHLILLRDTQTAVLTLDEVADLVASGSPLPLRAVVLTIDDADESFYTYAYPLLLKYGMRAHLFVPTGRVGSPWSDLNVCRWEQLAEMAASGAVLIESHTRNLHFKVNTERGMSPAFLHPDLIPMEIRTAGLQHLAEFMRGPRHFKPTPAVASALAGSQAPVLADLIGARLDIARGVGRAPGWLAWPYGFASATLDSLAKIAGYRGAVSLLPRAFSPVDSALHPGRFALTAKSTLRDIGVLVPKP